MEKTSTMKQRIKNNPPIITPVNRRKPVNYNTTASKGLSVRKSNSKSRTPSFMKPTWSSLKSSVKKSVSSPYKK